MEFGLDSDTGTDLEIKKSRKPAHLTISAWLQGLISLEEDSWNNETVNY